MEENTLEGLLDRLEQARIETSIEFLQTFAENFKRLDMLADIIVAAPPESRDEFLRLFHEGARLLMQLVGWYVMVMTGCRVNEEKGEEGDDTIVEPK